MYSSTLYYPTTYRLMVDLSSDWSVEIRFLPPKNTAYAYDQQDWLDDKCKIWPVETNLPFGITWVLERDNEFYFYDDNQKELLERWHEGDEELTEFFKGVKKDFLTFLKIISPANSWELIL